MDVGDNTTLLNQCLSSNVDYADHLFHRDVFDHIREAVVPTVSNNSCPPLIVLTYAIRNMMQPTLLIEQMTDFLTLLAHVNMIRKYAVENARAVLKWDEHYCRHPQSGISNLSGADLNLLETFTSENDEDQKMYREIISACYQLDIYHCYLHAPPAKFWSRLHMYFPGQFHDEQETDKESEAIIKKYLFHHGLTEKERVESRATGVRCAKFVSNAARFLEDPKTFCSTAGTPMKANFKEIFPPPDESAVVQSVDIFLQKVDFTVKEIERLFG